MIHSKTKQQPLHTMGIFWLLPGPCLPSASSKLLQPPLAWQIPWWSTPKEGNNLTPPRWSCSDSCQDRGSGTSRRGRPLLSAGTARLLVSLSADKVSLFLITGKLFWGRERTNPQQTRKLQYFITKTREGEQTMKQWNVKHTKAGGKVAGSDAQLGAEEQLSN